MQFFLNTEHLVSRLEDLKNYDKPTVALKHLPQTYHSLGCQWPLLLNFKLDETMQDFWKCQISQIIEICLSSLKQNIGHTTAKFMLNN